jgi:16S rRNA (cytosine967-C5)-methyltransferase
VADRPRELRSRRGVAAALQAIEAMGAGRPLRLALGRALRAHQGLGPRERRHAAVAVRGVARWLRVCDAALGFARAPPAIAADRALLRYLAWRVAVLGDDAQEAARDLRLPGPRRPRAISDAEVGRVARALPRPAAGVPLAVTAGGTPIRPPADPDVALALRHGFPDDFARRLRLALGLAEAEACLAALNEEPSIALRVNAARATRQEVLASLRRAGVAAAAGEGPHAIRVEDRAGLFDAAPLRRGLVEVQDEGSQAVVALCGARPGERWLDLCAGSGGKALGLAAAGARVTAWDANPKRLAELPRRARKAGLEVEAAPAEPAGVFDGVLVDAPCSGSGALRREPDARWRCDAAALDRFRASQLDLLSRSAGRVGSGGALVFATCSLFREEGEEVVEAFLRGRGDFALEEQRRRWPHRDPGAGFFLARLRRGPASRMPQVP